MLIDSLQLLTYIEPDQTRFSATETAGAVVGAAVFADVAGTGCFRQADGAATGVALAEAVLVPLGVGEAVIEPGPKPKYES